MIEVERAVDIPPGVSVTIDHRVVTARGPLGEARKDFSHAPVELETDGSKVYVKSYWPSKRELALVGTIASHIRNMVKGVAERYTYKLKIVFSHFPVTVRVQSGRVLIENFIGERSPRVAKIVGNCEVKVQGDDIIVSGVDLEEVSQTAANIQRATKIRKKDPRVFLDGIYIYEKNGVKVVG